MKRFFLFLIFPFCIKGQFAPAAGQPGSTAIKKDSSIIVNWANACEITRGYQDISNTGLGLTTVGENTSAIGPADGNQVVSLGDGGQAILNFPQAIRNGPGFDFCVFENSFDPGFLELAFVEVSSDGINYTRFPATCNVQNTLQIGPFDTSSDPTKINNLAGKYVAHYGVPFDLQELAGSIGLDLENITHVKLIDVVGCIQPQYARYDKNNNIINDLWSTPFPSSGFDLDAVGVIHQKPVGLNENIEQNKVKMFYNSSDKNIVLSLNEVLAGEIQVISLTGAICKREELDSLNQSIALSDLSDGIYLLKINTANFSITRKILVY
ncbi:MAG: T9SS type A sorting domain-containing protein [Sphingobacteriaceae bacterium]|nr:T9SS type A sorting domain-containing protein [Sphingobacteriaceae bacterium]